MLSRNLVFREVDTQADFMLPGGKLYVPGAERLLPNIRKLTDGARQDRVFLVSHGCFPRAPAPYQQILLEKKPLDIFASRHADELVKRLPAEAEFAVFGVVTEYCV